MSLKANIGFSRKLGEPRFSSRGASVNLEVELDNHLLEQSTEFLERIHGAFELARAAVDAELNSERSAIQEGPLFASIPAERERRGP